MAERAALWRQRNGKWERLTVGTSDPSELVEMAAAYNIETVGKPERYAVFPEGVDPREP